jgi:hypothetical protein
MRPEPRWVQGSPELKAVQGGMGNPEYDLPKGVEGRAKAAVLPHKEIFPRLD